MRRAVFLISLLVLAPLALAIDKRIPDLSGLRLGFQFSAAERAALAAAQADASEMPQEQRLLLRDALRRAVSSGQLDRLTREQKVAMLDAVTQAASHDASRDGVAPEERKRLLRDWVVAMQELEGAVFPQLPRDPNRYIIGRDVGPVSARTPVPDAPTTTQPGGDAPRPPKGVRIEAQPRDGGPAPPPPPVPPGTEPGTQLVAGEDGWTPAPSPSEMAEASAGPPEGVSRPDLSKAESAVGRGAGAASALADGTRSSAGGAGPGGGPGGASARGPAAGKPAGGPGAAAPGPAAPAASGDPSAPSSPADLALAAGPYKPAFEAAGLRVENRGGAPALLQRDGTPATPAQQAALAADVARMPRAAMRDPAYLDPTGGVSWERFQQLKSGYAEAKGREDFKHIALSKDERDFQRSESCDKVSGACNPHAKASYKKGEDVPAKELDSIWSRIHSYLAKSEAKDAEPRAARAALKSKGIWERVAAAFGLGAGEARSRPLVEAGIAAPGAAGQRPSAAPAAAAAPGDAESVAVMPDEPPAPRRRSALLTAVFAFGVVLAAVPLLRSRWLREY